VAPFLILVKRPCHSTNSVKALKSTQHTCCSHLYS